MNFAWRQTTHVMRSTNVQRFSTSCIPSNHGIMRNLTVTGWDPGNIAIAEHFELMFLNFLSIVWHISDILAGNDFSWNQISFVESLSNVDG